MASDCRSAQLSSIVGATAGGLPPQVAGGRWPVAGRLPPLTPLTPPPLPLPHAVARAFPGTGLEEGVKDRHSALGTWRCPSRAPSSLRRRFYLHPIRCRFSRR